MTTRACHSHNSACCAHVQSSPHLSQQALSTCILRVIWFAYTRNYAYPTHKVQKVTASSVTKITGPSSSRARREPSALTVLQNEIIPVTITPSTLNTKTTQALDHNDSSSTALSNQPELSASRDSPFKVGGLIQARLTLLYLLSSPHFLISQRSARVYACKGGRQGKHAFRARDELRYRQPSPGSLFALPTCLG